MDERMSQNEWDATARKWLGHEDSVCHEDRIARLVWMAEHTDLDGYQVFGGGLLANSLYEEMDYCFVYGQFLAASVLGLAYIERTIAAYFYRTGCDKLERASLQDLLAEALSRSIISRDQWKELERIRRTRNVYAHFRRPGHQESVECRAAADDESFYGIIEQDAISVVEAALCIASLRLM